MRDLIFGNISAATTDTTVYSANSIDFGASDSRLSDSSIKTGNAEEETIAFSLGADLASIDYVIPIVQDSADGSTWADVMTGPACNAGTKKGVFCTLPFPHRHRQYIRTGVTPKSSGVFTAVTVSAWIEPGVRV